jgi:hypothetical protein
MASWDQEGLVELFPELQLRAAAAAGTPDAQHSDDAALYVGLEVDMPLRLPHEPTSDHDSATFAIRPRDQWLPQDLVAHPSEFLSKKPWRIGTVLAPPGISLLDVLLRLP